MLDLLDRYRTKEHTGAMLAFVLDDSDAKALLSAVPMGIEPVSDLHLTLMYLGDTRALSLDTRERVRQALTDFTNRNGPITGTVSGVGRFTNDEGDGTNALYASFDAGELPTLRENLVKALNEMGVASPSDHGFTPHITLAYLLSDAPTPEIDVPVLKLAFREVTLAWADEHECFYLAGGGATPLQVLKQADGTYRWVLISSNSFEDRDREIVSQRALEADVARADVDGQYGPLLFWHLNGKRNKDGEQLPLVVLGQCDFNAMHGRMLIESGTFVSEAVALAVQKEAPTLEVSLGFEFAESDLAADGSFHAIRRTERSLLPRGKASNRLTALSVIHKELPMLKDKLAALKQVLGGNDELVNQVLLLAETGEKTADAAGLRSKEAVVAVDPCVQKHLDAGKSEAEAKALCEAARAAPPAPVEKEAQMSKKEFDAALTAVVGELDAVKAELHILKTASAEKAQRDTDTAARLKEAHENLTAVKAIAEHADQLAQELNGTLPRRLSDPLGMFRPSLNGREPSDRLKESMPHEENDPWKKHMDGFVTRAVPTPPGL